MNKPVNTCMSDFDPDSLNIEQAVEKTLLAVSAITDTEIVTLFNACNRVLATDIISDVNVPPERNSAMDGYAVRFEDLQPQVTELKLVGKSLAGHPFKDKLPAACAVRVTTGALVPEGADCVVMQEIIEVQDDTVVIPSGQSQFQFVREPGSDIAKGSTVLSSGCRIGPAEMGLMAATGITKVSVYRLPKICVFSTGDELTDPGNTLAFGQIYDSNRFVLAGLVQQAGAVFEDLGIIADTPEALEVAFSRARHADLVISTGGVSVGEADFVREVLEKNGTVDMWKVAMKPGRPLTLGRIHNGGLFFGLPGNPVSGMVTFHLFVTAALYKMQNLAQADRLYLSAVCINTLRKAPGRVEYQRGVIRQRDNGEWEVSTTGLQDSHVLSSMHKANCFIVLPIDSEGAIEGQTVRVLPFSGLQI